MQPKASARKAKGVTAIVVASVLFGLSYSVGSIVSAEGMSESGNGFWMGLMCIAFILLYNLVRRRNPLKRVTKKQLLLCAVVGVVGMWLSGYMFMIAYKYLSVPETTMLHFLHPVMIAIFMALVYKEKFTLATLGAMVCSIAGMFLITGQIVSSSVVGITAAVLSGVFYAVYAVLFDKSDLKKLEPTTAMLYIYLASSLASAVFSLAIGDFMLPLNATVWTADIFMAATGLVGYLLTAYSIRCLGATGASFGAMMEPITSILVAVVLFQEAMNAGAIWGSILVILSVVFISMNDLPRENGGAKNNEPKMSDG